MSDVQYLDEESFDEKVLTAELPVLVDFTAAWCGPCKMVSPIVEELAGEWDGKIQVYKVDVDQNQQTAMKFNVMGVPTLLLFVNGEEAQRLVGFRPKKQIVNAFADYL